MPRRLTPPQPFLATPGVRLEPLSQSQHAAVLTLTDDDEVRRFTRIPAGADAAFVTKWIDRYERGWEDGSCAGFATYLEETGELVGFAALVQLNLEHGEAEIGYMVGAAARGRGVATAVVGLLTEWSFGELGLDRLELRIDVDNTPSIRVAERNGYRLEGVLRSLYVKEGVRTDAGVWSRLRSDKVAP